MPIRSLVVAAKFGSYIFLGCQDEQDIRELTKLANSGPNGEVGAASQPVAGPLPFPLDKQSAHGGRRMPFPDRGGSIEWVHKSGDPTAQLYFLSSDMRPLNLISAPVMWLSESTGPKQITMVTCQPAEPGCWQAKSLQWVEEVPHGLIRFEVGRERYRIALPARQVFGELATQPTARTVSLPPEKRLPIGHMDRQNAGLKPNSREHPR